jgi:hypothetical protein
MVISKSFNTQQAKDFRFRLDKDAKAAVVQSIQQQPRELFMEVIHQLVCHLDDCLNAHGDYQVARTIHIQFGLKCSSYHDLIGHVTNSNTENDPSHFHIQFKTACYLAMENLDVFNINNLPIIGDKHNITNIQNFLLYTLSSTFMK